VTLAALHATRSGDDPLVLAADHLIANKAEFHATLSVAADITAHGKPVTFGIASDRPETGYGYIEQSAHPAAASGSSVSSKGATAAAYVEGGRHLWNGDMFLIRASRYIEEIKAHWPDVYKVCAAAFASLVSDMHFVRLDAAGTACKAWPFSLQ
jgi:mannose-1-phosphate guanylyltransferase